MTRTAMTACIGFAYFSIGFANAGEHGIASHYSTKEGSGSRVACGGYRLIDGAHMAAHRTAKCGSRLRVTNKSTGRSVVVTVVDRGPFVRGRIVDLTQGAAAVIGLRGLAHVTVDRQ